MLSGLRARKDRTTSAPRWRRGARVDFVRRAVELGECATDHGGDAADRARPDDFDLVTPMRKKVLDDATSRSRQHGHLFGARQRLTTYERQDHGSPDDEGKRKRRAVDGWTRPVARPSVASIVSAPNSGRLRSPLGHDKVVASVATSRYSSRERWTPGRCSWAFTVSPPCVRRARARRNADSSRMRGLPPPA